MDVIDTHQHFWHYDPRHLPWINDTMASLKGDHLPEKVWPEMQANGVTAGIAVQAQSRAEETGQLLTWASVNPSVCGVVGWVDLTLPDIDSALAKWLEHPKLKGFRHILQDERDVGAFIAQPAFNRGLRQLQAHQLTYDVLVFEHQMPDAVTLCARHDRHWLVLDHLGKPNLRTSQLRRSRSLQLWLQQIKQLSKLPHVVCKLSGLVTETDWQSGPLGAIERDNMTRCFDEVLDAFGPNRILFGSDWPVCTLAADYAAVSHFAREWAERQLSAAEQTRFWSGNATAVYNLSPAPTAVGNDSRH